MNGRYEATIESGADRLLVIGFARWRHEECLLAEHIIILETIGKIPDIYTDCYRTIGKIDDEGIESFIEISEFHIE